MKTLLNLHPLLLAFFTAISMAGGQLLFKLGAPHWSGSTAFELSISFIKNIYLVTAVFWYAVTILLWIYVLQQLPLSRAYPITALSYVIVPALSWVILAERVTPQVFFGSMLIIMGISLTSWQAG